MSFVVYLITMLIAVFLYICGWFLYGNSLNRLDVADEAWGLAQPFIVFTAIIIARNLGATSVALLVLTLIWGARLFWHLRKRHKRGGEDRRYVEMKKNWNTHPKLKGFVYVFLLQGGLMLLLSLASVTAIYYKSNLAWALWLGVLIWILGFVFEYSADKQLASFVANPENKGKIMDQKLWHFSRHPNYFGEVVMWWGIFVICTGEIFKIWTIISPLTITFLILFVSGIPLTERLFIGREGWEAYKAKTSILVPWFPKK